MIGATYAMARKLGELLSSRGWIVGTAESCTGGLLAAALTDVPGSSRWFEEGVITYANSSKQRLLDVPEESLEVYGAVSQQVVEAMVSGVLSRGADVAIATSGIAGPDGGSIEKPVGTVWFAWALKGHISSARHEFEGDRQQVRERAVEYALTELLRLLEEK